MNEDGERLMDEHKSHPTGIRISSSTTKVKTEGVALCVHPCSEC
jgi:hypothetical protein